MPLRELCPPEGILQSLRPIVFGKGCSMDFPKLESAARASLTTVIALCICVIGSARADELPSRHPFTVRDSVEMNRFGVNEDSEPNNVDDDGITSPDGRFVIKISHRGVVSRGVTEGTIWLFDAHAVEAGIRDPKTDVPMPVVLARLSANANGIPFIAEWGNTISRPSWIDGGRSLVFLGRDGRENRQLFQVNLATRELKALTPSNQNVIDYVWSNGVFTYLAGADVQAQCTWCGNGA